MGNKIGRRRQVVDDKYTRPQGLYQHRDIDQKKLRKLILESKLAPCYIGSEECGLDLEECPICFLCYPSLNRSRCCTKGICTECFLQLKPPHATQPTQCPFCKTSNYAVEYRGVKTKEEKGIEEVEEQKVIEAQIRIRRQQIQDEADKLKKIKDTNLSATIGNPSETESYTIETNGFVSSQASCSVLAAVPPSHCRQNRPYNFDREVDDIMVMEAIWLSIQEHGYLGYPAYHGNFLPAPTFLEECYSSRGIIPEISPYGGLACAAAALAERQLINFESGANLAGSSTSVFDALQRSGSLPAGNVRFVQNNPSGNWTDIPPDSGRQIVRQEIAECPTDPWSGMAVAGTGYAGSNIMVDPGNVTIPFLNCSTMSPRHFSPENFEEQMMVAMPLSLADSHARMPTQGLAWL